MPDVVLQAVPGPGEGADASLQLPHRVLTDGPVLQVAALQALLSPLLTPLQLKLLPLCLAEKEFPETTF